MAPSSPVLPTAAVEDVSRVIEEMDEGIDQDATIKDYNYYAADAVLEDENREERMKLLHTPEQPIKLSLDPLVEQFTSKQTHCVLLELIE
jgi:hypothetical protein